MISGVLGKIRLTRDLVKAMLEEQVPEALEKLGFEQALHGYPHD